MIVEADLYAVAVRVAVTLKAQGPCAWRDFQSDISEYLNSLTSTTTTFSKPIPIRSLLK